MAEETDTPKKRPAANPQVVYLYGAAADRRNKTARRSRTGRVPRQIRLGADMKTVVRRNKRVPVTLKWLKANIADVKAKIASGLIWVEDSSRKRAPEEWLKEMGLWVDPREGARNFPTAPKAVYNDNPSDDGGYMADTPEDEDETEGFESEEDDQDEEEDVTTPVRTAGEPLPKGWGEFVKRDLLALMEEREIPIGEDTRNDTLIADITAWAAERGLE